MREKSEKLKLPFEIIDKVNHPNSKEFQFQTDTGLICSIEGMLNQKGGFVDVIYAVFEYNTQVLEQKAQILNSSSEALKQRIANHMTNLDIKCYQDHNHIFYIPLHHDDEITSTVEFMIDAVKSIVKLIPQVYPHSIRNVPQHLCHKILILHASTELSIYGDIKSCWSE